MIFEGLANDRARKSFYWWISLTNRGIPDMRKKSTLHSDVESSMHTEIETRLWYRGGQKP